MPHTVPEPPEPSMPAIVEEDDESALDWESFTLTDLQNAKKWNETEYKQNARRTEENLALIDFGALPGVVADYEKKKMAANNDENRDGKTGAQRFEEKYEKMKNYWQTEENFLYPLTIVFRGPSERHYYKIMSQTRDRINTIILNHREESHLVENRYVFVNAVLSLILGSFDRQLPPEFDNRKSIFSADLFTPNNLKKEVAKGQTSHEYFAFLKDLLAYTITFRIGLFNTPPMLTRELGEFYNIIDLWLREIEDEKRENEQRENEQHTEPDWTSTTEEQSDIENRKNPDEQPNEQPANNGPPQNIIRAEIAERMKNYREQMASHIDDVNKHWCLIAIRAPAAWYNESLRDERQVTSALNDAMLIHDFGSISYPRTSKTGQEWDDIWPLARQMTLDKTTHGPNRPFLASVLGTLQTSLRDANAKRELRNGGKTLFFEGNSYNRAYQRAIGYALICVKRLFWRWCMDATFQNAVEEARVEEYKGYLVHALFTLTIWYRTVACYRAVQDSDKHDLNYEDENVKKCNITRMQLETPVATEVVYMGRTVTVAKHRLSNPTNNEPCCEEYVARMKVSCDKTYAELRDIWRLDASAWHDKAEIYANRILLVHLVRLKEKMKYGTKFVVKRYLTRRWNALSKRKVVVQETWLDYFPHTTWTGKNFFNEMYEYFSDLQEGLRDSTFRANSVFPGAICFSRNYIKRVRYLKTSLKRVLYMMEYKQINFMFADQVAVLDAILDVSVYLELVLAIYTLQQSESHSLDYRKASWEWKCEAELTIRDAKPVQILEGGGWGK